MSKKMKKSKAEVVAELVISILIAIPFVNFNIILWRECRPLSTNDVLSLSAISSLALVILLAIIGGVMGKLDGKDS